MAVKQTVQVLTAKKARDIVVIDVTDRSSFADHLIIASTGSERQLGTLAAELADKLAEDGLFPKNVEGKKPSGWILMDYGDLIVNLFSEEQRSRYNLEKIWGDGQLISAEELLEQA
ncbi:MAG TPA: ribosome silencing factor [Clostridiales bacterium]|nr:ribosome silencing factor [Clostridiales bacterium]